MPGIYGDSLELLQFQTKLSPDVLIEIIELQSLEEPLSELMSVEAAGRAVAREIEHRFPEGVLRLAGYSFGGAVAFEAARHLVSSGRSLHFLGLIDVLRPDSAVDQNERGRLGQVLLQIGRVSAGEYGDFSGILHRLLRKLVGRFCSSDLRLRLVLSAITRFCPTKDRSVRRMLLWHFRRRALSRWQPAPSGVRAFLAVSQENLPSLSEWEVLCPQAEVIRLPGKHDAIFQSPAFEMLLAAFRKAVQNTCHEPPSS